MGDRRVPEARQLRAQPGQRHAGRDRDGHCDGIVEDARPARSPDRCQSRQGSEEAGAHARPHAELCRRAGAETAAARVGRVAQPPHRHECRAAEEQCGGDLRPGHCDPGDDQGADRQLRRRGETPGRAQRTPSRDQPCEDGVTEIAARDVDGFRQPAGDQDQPRPERQARRDRAAEGSRSSSGTISLGR